MHAWRAVGAPAAGMDLADLFAEIGVAPASAATAGATPRRSSRRVPHPARDIAGRPGGVASPRRSAGSSSPVTGLPGEENRGLAQDLALLAQIPVLPAQPAQLLALDGGEAIAAATCVQIGLADPLTNSGLGQVQLPGDLADRLAGACGSARRLQPCTPAGRTVGGVASDSHLEGRALILGVHQAGSTPVMPIDGSGLARMAAEKPLVALPRERTPTGPRPVGPVLRRTTPAESPPQHHRRSDPRRWRRRGPAQPGERAGGYALYVKGGKLRYVHNYVGRAWYSVESDDGLGRGTTAPVRVRTHRRTRPPAGQRPPGRLQLYIDDNLVGNAEAPVTVPFALNPGVLTCGANPGSPVTPDYPSPSSHRHPPHRDRGCSGELIQDPEADCGCTWPGNNRANQAGQTRLRGGEKPPAIRPSGPSDVRRGGGSRDVITETAQAGHRRAAGAAELRRWAIPCGTPSPAPGGFPRLAFGVHQRLTRSWSRSGCSTSAYGRPSADRTQPNAPGGASRRYGTSMVAPRGAQASTEALGEIATASRSPEPQLGLVVGQAGGGDSALELGDEQGLASEAVGAAVRFWWIGLLRGCLGLLPRRRGADHGSFPAGAGELHRRLLAARRHLDDQMGPRVRWRAGARLAWPRGCSGSPPDWCGSLAMPSTTS